MVHFIISEVPLHARIHQSNVSERRHAVGRRMPPAVHRPTCAIKRRDTSLIAAIDAGPPRSGNSTVSCHLLDLKVGTVDFASHSRGG